MKLGYKIGIGIGAAFALFLGYKAYTLKDTVKTLQLKIKSFRVSFPKLYLTLQVFNPSGNSVTIDSIVGTIYFNQESIGSIQYINKVPILASSYSDLPDVLVDLSPTGLLTLTNQILTQTAASGTLIFAGNIYYKGIAFPFRESIKVY